MVVHCSVQVVERAPWFETVRHRVARTFSSVDGKGIFSLTSLLVQIENENSSLYFPSP
jgi:hypothetical protein